MWLMLSELPIALVFNVVKFLLAPYPSSAVNVIELPLVRLRSELENSLKSRELQLARCTRAPYGKLVYETCEWMLEALFRPDGILPVGSCTVDSDACDPAG